MGWISRLPAGCGGWLFMAAVAVSFVHVAGAQAQPSPEEVEAAQRAYAEGEALMEQGLYGEALARFQASYRRMEGHPNQPLILFQVARAHQQIGSRCRARVAYQRFLESGEAQFREQALRELRNVEAELAASGTTCGGGGALGLVGPLVLVVGGAAVVAGVVTGILSLDAQDRLSAACDEDRVCPPAQRGLVQEYDALRLSTDVLLVSGLALVATGVVLTVVLSGRGDDDDPLALGGTCGPTGCLVEASARF